MEPQAAKTISRHRVRRAFSSADYKDLAEHWRGHLGDFAADTLIIADKNKRLTNLSYTYLQKRAARIYQQLVFLGVPVRIINLKARQVMMSTFWTSVAYHRYYYSTGPLHITLIGDKYDTTHSLAQMIGRYHQYFPKDMRWPTETKMSVHVEDALKMKRSGAYFRLETAKYLRAGQSTTGSIVIATEVPYYAHAEDVFVSLLQTVPETPSSMVVLEGTANGASGYFYDTWNAAEKRCIELSAQYGARDKYDLLFNESGWGDGTEYEYGFWDGSWFPLFFAWWENPEYVWPAALEDVTDDNLNEDELRLRAMFDLTNDQFAWRRRFIRDKLKGNVDKFKQEYPSWAEEAFLFSGSPVFDMVTVTRREKETYAILPKLIKCDLEWSKEEYPKHLPTYNSNGQVTNRRDLKVKCVNSQLSHFLLIRRPRNTHFDRYCIGADVATGKGGGKGDYSVFYVMDRITGEYVMQFRAILSTKAFAEKLAQAGMYYHNAGILIEENGPGDGVISRLFDIYDQTKILCGFVVKNGRMVPGTKPGWRSSRATASGGGVDTGTKVIMVDDLADLVINEPERINFYHFWNEGRSYVRDDWGRMDAERKRQEPGSDRHDDAVDAAGLTFQAHKIMPAPRRRRPLNEVERETKRGEIRQLVEGYEI